MGTGIITTVNRHYGAFQRAFSLPETVDVDKVAASYDNGVLKVTLPKKEAAKQGRPFTGILKEGQAAGRWPNTPVVAADFLALQAEKTKLIREHILGQRTDAREKLQACGEAEVDFYVQRGLLKGYAELNGV